MCVCVWARARVCVCVVVSARRHITVLTCHSIAQFIKRHDVVIEIDGVRVGDDGTIPLREGERVSVEYLASNHPVGETMEVKILRGGKVGRAKHGGGRG